MKQEPNYFAVIPLYILEAKDLRPNAKLLYAEISSLTRKNGVCTATNAYLAERIGMKKRAIEDLTRELHRAGYIRLSVKGRNGGTYRDILLTPPVNTGYPPGKQRRPPRWIPGTDESMSKSIKKKGVYTPEERERIEMGIFPH